MSGKTKVAINGFGRIGRLVFRALLESDRQDIEIVAVNDLAPIATNAHLLQFDSTHGKLPYEVKVEGDYIIVKDQKVKCVSERDPADLPWGELGIDVVAECTGFFLDSASAGKHIEAGAKKVLISAPSKGDDILMSVYGVNDDKITSDMKIISNASCTTNCLAPVVSVLNEKFGVEHGYMTTIHAFTGDQRTLDTFHSDPRRARTASASMIPTSTGAAKAVGKVLPEMLGKLDGCSIRVPTEDVSVVDLTCVVKRDVTAEEVNAALKEASEGKLKGILGYNELPLVSVDFLHDSHSSVFDATQTTVMQGNFLRVVSWYDNEWGFSNRMLDTIAKMMSV